MSQVGYSNVNGNIELSVDKWASIDWKLVKRNVKKLRQRIYRATKEQEWKKVRNLQKLTLRSYSNLQTSVRKITQENKGRKTPGIDGKKYLKNVSRVRLLKQIQGYETWKVKPTKRVYIPKSNGKKRPLGIPVIRDRILQSVVKNALEPEWEAKFEPNSFGFRPGRSTQDAAKQCWTRLNANCGDNWILDADIKGAFDNISHDYLLQATGNFPGQELIKKWLKAGYIDNGKLHGTETGTPQGGTISPLLSNIALQGLEDILNSYVKKTLYEHTVKSGKWKGRINRRYLKSKVYGFARYADDFVITAKTKEDLDNIVPVVIDFLKIRGLQINQEKTKISHISDGFDFLGFNIRRFDGKCLVKPQKSKILAKLREIKTWLSQHKTITAEKVIRHLNPIIRGLGNYYSKVNSKKVFSYISHRIWKMLWQWTLRRHPKKGKNWVKQKYFCRFENKDWTFHATTKNILGENQITTLFDITSIPIREHIKVKGKSSPDDASLNNYWDKRNRNEGKNLFAKGSVYGKVASSQEWKCTQCGEFLINGESLHLHHKIPIKKGGKDKISNYEVLHQSCHIIRHKAEPQLSVKA